MQALPEPLVARVLGRLGVERPARDLSGLASLYSAWCRSVPFDNVRKMIHVREGNPGPLPGDEPREFLEDWLADGTGGTCWAGNGALCALLEALGFEASRAIATMLVVPDVPPNHGSVSVRLSGHRYLTDASILHGEPLLLDETRETTVPHPAWGVRSTFRDDRFHVHWRPLHLPGGFPCRIERLVATDEEFRALHEQTRTWSPFNFQLSVRRIRGDGVVGVGFGRRGEILANGEMVNDELSSEARAGWLGELGFSREIAAQLPDDVATPPPPGSSTAALRDG